MILSLQYFTKKSKFYLSEPQTVWNHLTGLAGKCLYGWTAYNSETSETWLFFVKDHKPKHLGTTGSIILHAVK